MFRFKKFAVAQDRCSMKVGTDGVLLGAWTRVVGSERCILDIGTGTGLIALQLAQRTTTARITGIDIADVSQARENVAASPWAERVDMMQCAAQDFEAEAFDLIVSNPPYFVDSLTCPDAGRSAARHATELSFAALYDAAARLLAPAGRLCLVLPLAEMELFISECRELHAVRRTEVYSKPDSGVRRVLVEFSRERVPLRVDVLTIGTGRHEEYTEEYMALTRDFYLKF